MEEVDLIVVLDCELDYGSRGHCNHCNEITQNSCVEVYLLSFEETREAVVRVICLKVGCGVQLGAQELATW